MLKRLKHRLLLIKWLISQKKSNFDFVAEAFISVAARWHGEIDPIRTYLAMFSVLRLANFKGRIVEFGGGYSTVFASGFINIAIKDITSVDFNPSKYDRILNSSRNAERFLSGINSKPRVSVTLQEVHESLQALLTFLDANQGLVLSASLARFGYKKDFELNQLSQDFTSHPSYKMETGFYSKFDAVSGSGFCREIIEEKLQFDAYFFDCGEISSIAEFWLLKDHMKNGDFVLLHDIYYPKSIKNFLVACYLCVDPDWKVIFEDNSSAQGGLVARKVVGKQ